MFKIINYEDVKSGKAGIGQHFPRNILRESGQIKVNKPKGKRDAFLYKWHVPSQAVQEILLICSRLTEDEILEHYHGEYYVNEDVQKAFKIMCIREHEVDEWIYLHTK